MILLNKSLLVQDIILTLSENTSLQNPVYLLVLTNDFNKRVYRFLLENNISAYKGRYDHFAIDTSSIRELDSGSYSYAVYESASAIDDESLLGNAIERGNAKVIAPAEIIEPIIYKSDEDLTYYTYNSIND
ncbi:MAG: hypothetical protein V4520_02455 [Bacteroidota bacterium]